MKFENTEVWGFEHAIRGMRNHLESWDKSDSEWETHLDYNKYEAYTKFAIGKNDLKLMQKLIKTDSGHLRQIVTSVDITGPSYFMVEFDAYTVANNTLTMHKLVSKPITLDCFEMGDFEEVNLSNGFSNTKYVWNTFIIPVLEELRQIYNTTKDKRYWKELVRLLPESWLQTRTVTMSYENIRTMIHQQTNHKLTEWSKDFIEWAKTLPYSEELLFFNQTSYKDTIELEKENEQLKQQVSNLENDLRIIRKNLEALKDGVENGLIEFLKVREENKQLRVAIGNKAQINK